MKKTLLIAGVLILSGLIGSAQKKYSLEWGDITPLESEHDDVQTTRLGERHFTLEYAPVNTNGKHVTVKLFDAQGKKLKEAKFEFKGLSTLLLGQQVRLTMERLIQLGDRYYFLLREVDIRGRQIHCRAFAFDPENLTVAKEPITLASVANLDATLSTYLWTISADRDRIHFLESPGKGQTPAAKLTVKTYDRQLKRLSEREFTLSPDLAFLTVTGIKIAYGHIVISGRNFQRRPTIWTGNPPGFTALYFILPNGEQALQVVPIELPGVLAAEERHVFENADEFLSYGLYRKTSRWAHTAEGAFFARYSIKRRRLETPQLRVFPPSIVQTADYRDKKARTKNPEELQDFRVGDLRHRPDGGLQFIAEQSKSRWWSHTSTNFDESMEVTTSGMVYQHDDIMVYTLYRDPARDWFALIRKQQLAFGTNREYSFTHNYDKNGTLWILYNDLPGNLSLPPEKVPAKLKVGENKMATVLVRIDPRGKVDRELLFTKKEIGLAFAPRQTTYAADGSIRLVAFGKKSYRLGLLRLQPMTK